MRLLQKVGTFCAISALFLTSVFAALPSGSHVGPSAHFTVNPSSVLTLNPVSFDASASRDARGSDKLQYRWDFKENYGWTRWMASPKTSYTYEDPGDYKVRLQVKDADDMIDETSATIQVQTKRSQHAPFAKIHVDSAEGNTSTSFYFTVEVFSRIHTPTYLLEVRWDWDHDGVWDTSYSRAREFFHAFGHEGWKEVWLEVKDTDGSSSIEKGFYVEGKENDSLRTKEVGRILVDKATAPRAAFKTWPVEISPGTNVHFDGSESIRAVEYRWDFDGDGRFDVSWRSANKKVQRVYNFVGVFDAILEVRNSAGEIDRTQRAIAVTDSNNILPEAKIRVRNRTNATLGSSAAVLRDEVQFSASGSRDEDGSGNRMEVRWDFEGDGIFDTTFSKSKTAIHRYTATGWFVPTLQVRDERGGLGSAQARIKVVANTAPLASLEIKPNNGSRETKFRFDASGTRDDQTKTSNLDYRFDFDGDGLFDTEFKSSRSYSRKLNKTGKFTAVVEVRDHANAVSRATAEFEIAEPVSPKAAFLVEPRVGTFNTNFEFDAGLTDDDPRLERDLKYRWDFNYRGDNDISYHTGWMSSPTYRHRFKEIGSHHIRLTVKNSVGQESEFFTKIKIHEESESLEFLRRKRIITDDSNPESLITRAGLAKMIVKALKIKPRRSLIQQFTDVDPRDPFAPYITAVSQRGWISAKADFVWNPNSSVNRAEAAKIVVSALFPHIAMTSSSQLKDVSSNAWYARFAKVVLDEDLLEIQNGEFKPAQPVTKAETARMIAKMLQKYSTELRLSNFLEANDFDFHASASKGLNAQDLLSSLLEKIKGID